MNQKKNIKLGLNNFFYLFFLFIYPCISFADETIVKLKFKDQIVQKDLEGYQYLNQNFLAKYKREHILGISNNLK